MARLHSHHPLLPPPLRWRDCGALVAALTALCQLAQYVLHDADEVLATARKIRAAAGRLIKAEAANARIALKLEMLSEPAWRGRVLRELGGARALDRWQRIMGRRFPSAALCHPPLKPHPSPAQRAARRANLALARAAKRQSFKHQGGLHPLIYKDCVKVDSRGQFRLAPLPRKGPRLSRSIIKRPALSMASPAPRQARIKRTRIKPISLWPIEFNAARAARPRREMAAPSWDVYKDKISSGKPALPPPFRDSG